MSTGATTSQPVRYDVVVVAAGSSRRMGELDKLDAPLAGRPVLARTLAALAAAAGLDRLVLVASPERVAVLRSAARGPGSGDLPAALAAVVVGGARRQESVALGLAELDRLDADLGSELTDERVVLIHDGARPLVRPDLVASVAEAVRTHGAAVPLVPVVETLKRIDGDRVVATIDRERLAVAQTPQGATRGRLRVALAARDPWGPDEWTDEAALLESCSIPVHVVPGDPSNLKVTLPEDLARAEALLGPAGAIGPAVRVGIAHDSHPFGPGEPLALGGLEIAGAPRLAGHSDGDVALHAVADALLGAVGLGDLGRRFPAGPETPRGVASGRLVVAVVEEVRAAGYRPASVDVTIVGARPRLAGHLPAMARAIAGLLGIPPERVSVKASTGNLAGDEGAGRAMSAQAVAVVQEVRS